MNKTITNFLWRFAERCGAQLVTFVVSIVLARILTPEDYGTVALVTVFTNIMQVFINSGLSTALIQKKDADDLDFSSVFYFNLIVCIFLYMVMFFIAPLIAAFYGKGELTPIVRVISITLLISGVKGVQQAYVSKKMIFKRFFYSTIGGTIVSAVLGIIMAYKGCGVWAIVMQQLSNTAIDTLILWLTVEWHPKLSFSIERLRTLLGYGWKMLCSSLLETVYNNLRNLLIGKIYSSVDLAYYNQGQKFPNLIVNNINTSIDSVLLPTMAAEQDNLDRVKCMTRRSIMVSCYIMAPLMIGMACCAEEIISVVLTDKWMVCAFYLRIFCITYMFWPIHTANLNAIKAMGRSDLFLKLEIWKKIIGLILLMGTIFISVEAMAYSLLINTITSMLINSWPNKKLLNYSFKEQILDIMPGIFLAMIMGGVISFVPLLGCSSIAILIIQILLGAILYIGLSAIFKVESFLYLCSMVKSILQKK